MDLIAIITIIGGIIGIVLGLAEIYERLQKRRKGQADPGQSTTPGQDAPAPTDVEHVVSTSAANVPDRVYLILLRKILTERFNESELRTLCFDLDVDYGSLPGEGKADKARELVAYLERRDRISDLIDTGRRLRPDIDEWSQAQLDVDMERLRVRRDQADRTRREMRERQRVVNLRPLDVMHTFKDRLREIQSLCEHLADANVRLVSIVGRGGMGKTALASRVLGDLERGMLPVPGQEEGLPIDGILYLSARSTGLGLERIYADVGRMLGEPSASKLATRWASRDAPLTNKVEYLLESMQDGLYLILLDNLEDELTEEGEIAEEGLRLFVERCLIQPGGARLIATSREQVRFVDAALRNARSIPLREGLPEDEAIALLRDLDPDRTLGLHNAPDHELRRAVRLTQSIPRALEILAGILREDPVASLVRLLDDEGLFGERVVERLVAQGYQRLGEDERRVMEALAVFDRPVEETAVAFLLHPWLPAMDVRASLRRLASGYFVSASRVTGEYELHPLDRDHAYRTLSDAEGLDVYNRRDLELRAVAFYVSIRKPENEWKSIEDLAPQLAEFEHRVRAGDFDGACQVLEPIDFDHLYLWGHYTRLVGFRETLLDKPMEPRWQANNMGWLGLAWHALGKVKRATDLYKRALAIARDVGDRASEGRHLRNLGSAYRDMGQSRQAIECYEDALAIFKELGNRRDEGATFGNLGNVYHYLGQFDQATEYYEQALAIYLEIGDHRREGAELSNLGDVYRAEGQVEQAISVYEVALSIAREVGDRRAEGAELGGLGHLYRSLGKVDTAIKLFQESLAIANEIGNRRQESVQLGHLGTANLIKGWTEQAADLFQEALVIAHEVGDRRRESIWLNQLGRVYYILKQNDQAKTMQKQALTISREIGYLLGKSYQLLGLALVSLADGEFSKARRYCLDALVPDVPETSFRLTLTLGIALLYQRDPDTVDTFVSAASLCRALLDKTEGLYEARYMLAAALLGQAVCDSRWANEGERAELLGTALAEYRRALDNCSAPGVVGNALRDLELIRAAGIEGLEPVFELLESALAESRSKWAKATVVSGV